MVLAPCACCFVCALSAMERSIRSFMETDFQIEIRKSMKRLNEILMDESSQQIVSGAKAPQVRR